MCSSSLFQLGTPSNLSVLSPNSSAQARAQTSATMADVAQSDAVANADRPLDTAPAGSDVPCPREPSAQTALESTQMTAEVQSAPESGTVSATTPPTTTPTTTEPESLPAAQQVALQSLVPQVTVSQSPNPPSTQSLDEQPAPSLETLTSQQSAAAPECPTFDENPPQSLHGPAPDMRDVKGMQIPPSPCKPEDSTIESVQDSHSPAKVEPVIDETPLSLAKELPPSVSCNMVKSELTLGEEKNDEVKSEPKLADSVGKRVHQHSMDETEEKSPAKEPSSHTEESETVSLKRQRVVGPAGGDIVQHATHPSRTQSAQPSALGNTAGMHHESPPSQQAQSPGSAGPFPRNLPKNAKTRPRNARVFVGNLASEFTNPFEMVKIFYKYGELIEEPVLRRSFGFIQYGNAEAATRAVIGEQGRIIGGIPIDLSIADNREVKRGTHVVNNTPFPHGPKNRGRGPPAPPVQQPPSKRRRSISPGGPSQIRRIGGVHPPQFRRSRPEPRNGIFLRVLCMSALARNYASQCQALFRSELKLDSDIVQIVATGLGDALAMCMRDVIPYVLVVASKNVEEGTCTIRTLERTGYEKAGRGNGIISLREAIDVCLIDRGIPLGRVQPGQSIGARPVHPPPPNVQMVQAGWSKSNPNPMGAPDQSPPMRKPGWMSGSRAPPHPQQPAHLRGAPIQGAGMAQQVMGGPPHAQPMSYMQNPVSNPMNVGARPDARMQYDRQQGYGMPDQQQYMSQAAGQVGWSSGAQPAMANMQQAQSVQYPGRYGAPSGMMGGRGGPVNSSRDKEYDPAAVMPPNGGQQGKPYSGWSAPQDGYGQQVAQDSYGRQGYPYNYGDRPDSGGTSGAGSRMRDAGPPPAGMAHHAGNGYMRPPQGSYRQEEGVQYSGSRGANQGYPAGYGGAGMSGSMGSYGNYGPGGDRSYDEQRQANWGANANVQYDRSNPTQGYEGGNPAASRVGGGYNDSRNVPPHSQSSGALMYANGNTAGGGGSRPTSNFDGGNGGGVSNSGQNGPDGGRMGASLATPGGVDIGKLTNLISAFQQQQNTQQQYGGARDPRNNRNEAGSPAGSAAPGRNGGPAPLLTQPSVAPRMQNGQYNAYAQQNYSHGPPQMYQRQSQSHSQGQGQGQRNYYGR